LPTIGGAFVTAINAETGDQMAQVEIDSASTFSLHVLGSQTVALQYLVSYGPGKDEKSGWYGARDLTHATKLKLPATGTVTANFSIG
jgi:hypothetical protein